MRGEINLCFKKALQVFEGDFAQVDPIIYYTYIYYVGITRPRSLSWNKWTFLTYRQPDTIHQKFQKTIIRNSEMVKRVLLTVCKTFVSVDEYFISILTYQCTCQSLFISSGISRFQYTLEKIQCILIYQSIYLIFVKKFTK